MRRASRLRSPGAAWHRAFSQRRVLAQPAPESHPHIMAAGEVTPGLAASEYAERCAESSVVLPQPPQRSNALCAGELPSQTFYQTDRWPSSQRRHSRICRTTCHFHVRDVPFPMHRRRSTSVGASHAPPPPTQTTKTSTCSTCAGSTSTHRSWLASSPHRTPRHGGTSL